jgi:hypothetical protein
MCMRSVGCGAALILRLCVEVPLGDSVVRIENTGMRLWNKVRSSILSQRSMYTVLTDIRGQELQLARTLSSVIATGKPHTDMVIAPEYTPSDMTVADDHLAATDHTRVCWTRGPERGSFPSYYNGSKCP